MCKDCGCAITDHEQNQIVHSHHQHDHKHDHLHNNPQLNDAKTLSIIRSILNKNDHEAVHNREHFAQYGVTAINLMSSPGSGKTTFLEHLWTQSDLKYAVIEGDLETSRDADRIKAKGIQAYQIQTGSACHLDAFMVHNALHHLKLEGLDLCFIENVGNLVCPASYDVGAHLNIVLISVPEGDDKVEKYPVMFRRADLVLMTKSDLLPHFNFNTDEIMAQVKKLNPKATVLSCSVQDPESIKAIAGWIKQNLNRV